MLTKNKINWKLFFENTSTRESLWDFVDGYSIKKSFQGIRFPDGIKTEIAKIAKRVKTKGLEKTIASARKALARHG